MSKFLDEGIESEPDYGDIRAMARRQFVASVAVAFVIALSAALMAMAPSSRHYTDVASHRVATIQLPKSSLQAADSFAAKQHRGIELP
jgi:hypothetical protein